jgi:hypothetical protein
MFGAVPVCGRVIVTVVIFVIVTTPRAEACPWGIECIIA